MDPEDRMQFLERLDGSDQVSVNAWEAKFIENNMNNATMTPAQATVVDNLVEKYGGRIGW